MALFDIRPDLSYETTMQLWQKIRKTLKEGDLVSFSPSSKEPKITGKIKSFANWWTAEIVEKNGQKWGVGIANIEKQPTNNQAICTIQ